MNQMQSGTIFNKRVTRPQDGGGAGGNKKGILLSDSEVNLKVQPAPPVARLQRKPSFTLHLTPGSRTLVHAFLAHRCGTACAYFHVKSDIAGRLY